MTSQGISKVLSAPITLRMARAKVVPATLGQTILVMILKLPGAVQAGRLEHRRLDLAHRRVVEDESETGELPDGDGH